MAPRAIALDFDGVLVDSQPLHAAAWREVLGREGAHIPDLESRILGVSATHFASSIGLGTADARRLAAAKEAAVIELAVSAPPPLYPHVRAQLPILANEFRLAIVSSAHPSLLRTVLGAHDLLRFMGVIVTGDKAGTPSPYANCLEQLGLPATLVVAVEDTPLGIRAARASNLGVIGIINTTPPERLADADVVISAFDELPAAVHALFVAA